jgi:hypothetical protein
MGSEFLVYLRLGFDHIADLSAYDHILFIVALSAGYGLAHWRQLLVLVTAFTVGHSVTLALATLRLISISSGLVEILIPLTILITGCYNAVEARGYRDATGPRRRTHQIKYVMALGFGLIHGLGFSTFLRAVLGEEESIALPLFSFNVGLEVGQIGILSVVLLFTFAVIHWVRVERTSWVFLLSGVTGVAALALLAGRIAG